MSKEKKPMDEVDAFYAFAALLIWGMTGVLFAWILSEAMS